MVVLLLTLTTLNASEVRYYFVRGGQLPDDVTTVDLRPEHSSTIWTMRNIYRNETARYALFEKRADSWWQVAVETAPANGIDLSAIDESWTLCIRLRRTVNYALTLCLFGQTTDEGYTISTSTLPADGQWRTLTIPLSQFSLQIKTDNLISGSLFRLHSDAGYAGDEVGIDFCYLTHDLTTLDQGQVQAEKRYYLITNDRTPLNAQYNINNLSQFISARYSGWMQWAYIPFPYYSMDMSGATAMQLCSTTTLPMTDVDDDWALIAQVQTDMQGPLAAVLYLNGMAYSYHIDDADLVRDGQTWNRLYLPLDEAQMGTYTTPTPVVFSIKADNLSAGVFSVGSLMITNNHSASDPDPLVPGDPANGKQIWLVNDGTPLPDYSNITDYRLFYTDYLTANYGNSTQRNTADSWLTLMPTNGWWSIDMSAAKPIDLTAVQADWTLHTRVKTTSTYRPINLILYLAGNQELKRYTLTDTNLPISQNGTWFDIDIPMSEILTSVSSLPAYNNGNRVFSFHSDGGGTAGVEVSMQYLYFSLKGETTPAPIEGDKPLDEPAIEELPDTAIDNVSNDIKAKKIIINGRLYIRFGDKTYDVLGNLVF